MTNNEYEYLISSIDELKAAETAFNNSYCDGKVTEEQVDLYHRLQYQLDEVYIMANMLIENENYRRDRRHRKNRSSN